MRNRILWGVLVVVLVVANGAIAGKERVLRSGATVLLELAPVDPRSLMQGDYMALRYRLAEEVRRRLAAEVAQDRAERSRPRPGEDGSSDGRVVVTLDADGVAAFERLDDGSPLAEGELVLRYRQRGSGVRVASDAFFFEEGSDSVYAGARYGELKVDRSGSAVLVGLRDQELRPLGGR